MTVELAEYIALIVSSLVVAVEAKKVLNRRANKGKRIERHVDASRDKGYNAAAKPQRPWLQEEILADRARIRQRLIVAVVASLLADIAIFDLNRRLFLFALMIEAVLIPLVAVAEAASKIRNELRQRVEIEANLPLEIEKLALYLGSGLSLNSSFYRLAKTSSTETRAVFIFIAQGLQSGLPVGEVLEECYLRFPTDSIRRITNLLAGGASGGDLVRVTREEAANQRGVRHLNALAKMEKVTQSVWIPITIAALLPGIAIVFIPFFSILTSLKG